MQNQDRILRLIVLFFVLALAVAVFNFTCAQQIKPGLHTLDYLANKQSSKQIAYIPVGQVPQAIGVDFNLNKIYVVPMLGIILSL
jgi:DNA-binding beta-propeller fold protein YncE